MPSSLFDKDIKFVPVMKTDNPSKMGYNALTLTTASNDVGIHSARQNKTGYQ
jgi:hypothetical protein